MHLDSSPISANKRIVTTTLFRLMVECPVFRAFIRILASNLKLGETLINSEFPQHKDVLPFSMTNKSLKMKKKGKSHFRFFVL